MVKGESLTVESAVGKVYSCLHETLVERNGIWIDGNGNQSVVNVYEGIRNCFGEKIDCMTGNLRTIPSGLSPRGLFSLYTVFGL